MAEPRRGRDRRPDIEALAAHVFARRVVAATGKTPEAVAAEAIAAARAFYATLDGTPAAQPERP